MERWSLGLVLWVGAASFALGCGPSDGDARGAAGAAGATAAAGSSSQARAGGGGGGSSAGGNAGTVGTGGASAAIGGSSAGNGTAEKFPRAFGAPETLLPGLTHPARLHVRDGYLYFTDMGLPDGTHSRLARRAANGSVETLFEGLMVAALFMDKDEMFFAERGTTTVHRMKYATLVPELLATHDLMVADIERSGDDLWMTLYDASTLRTGIVKRNLSTGAETTVAATISPGFIFTYLAAAGDSMYISTTRVGGSAATAGLFRMSGAEGGLWASNVGPQFAAVTAAHVYFGDELAGVILRRAHAATATSEVVASNQMMPYGVAVDGGGVYWTSSQGCNGMSTFGAVRAVPFDSADVASVAEMEACPESITTDADFVYWARNPDVNSLGNGSIVRAAKLL